MTSGSVFQWCMGYIGKAHGDNLDKGKKKNKNLINTDNIKMYSI